MCRRIAAIILILSLLSTAPGGWPAAPPHACADEPVPAESEPSFISRHRTALLWSGGLIAAGTGIAAVGYRRAANRRFDDYERTADPVAIETLYDQARSLDQRAAALFIVAELAFVATVYVGFFVKPASSSMAVATPGRLSFQCSAERAAICWRF
jgi:hypothetical protein